MFDEAIKGEVQSVAQAALEAVLDKMPEVKALLEGQPVELVITLQLKPKQQ